MGQRTAILIKRNFKNGTHDTRLIHYQWGFGKTMIAHFMQEFLKSQYNYDNYNKSLKNYFKFDIRKNYTYKTSKKDVNVWDKNTILNWFENTDNNNGGMIIEVTEVPQKDDDNFWYFKLKDVKIGFVLGYEECNYDEKLDKYLEQPFEKIVSANEYMVRTGGERYCPQCFRESFEKFCETFDIEQVVDK